MEKWETIRYSRWKVPKEVAVASLAERVDRLETLVEKLFEAQYETQVALARMSRDIQALSFSLARDTERFRQELRAELAESNRQFHEQLRANLHTELTEANERFRQELRAELTEANERFRQELRAELAEANERFRQELRAELAESNRQFHEQLRANLHTELTQATERFRQELRKEVDRAIGKMNQQWGDMARKLGTITEDLVYPNIPRLSSLHFGAPDETAWEFLGQRIKKRHQEKGTLREFDVVAAWPGHLVIVEVKATVRSEYLTGFAKWLASGAVWDYFPEWQGRRVIPIFASFSLQPNEVAFLTRHKIYAMALGPETMALVNAAQLPFVCEGSG